MQDHKTICAIATATSGAIGIVRISGDNAIEIANKIFKPRHGNQSLSERKANSVIFGDILNKDSLLDEVLLTIFRAPHSYTGEDSVEIACHGSNYILQSVLELLIENGCQIANHGEYTQRAFLNGKMDLSQAEGVADLIASNSKASHQLAMSQMRGGFSKELKLLRDKLLKLTSLMELELDFSDHEELEFADRSELRNLSKEVHGVLHKLINSFQTGNAIKNGIPISIVGETNVGKSTLLNALLNDDRAIVSDIHGTTRDVIEDTINFDGILFRFIDTAGIRKTEDQIENLGIQKTFAKIEQAMIILWLIDVTRLNEISSELKEQIIHYSKEKRLLLLFNKSEQLDEKARKSIIQEYREIGSQQLFISAKHHKGIESLKRTLVSCVPSPEEVGSNGVIVTNVRHLEALKKADTSIERVTESLASELSGDFISQDLRECIYHLNDIIGEVTTTDVLENIFKHFCIGK